MRVAVYYNNRDHRIEERPRPQAGPGEIVMRVEASGLCGSDLMEFYRVPKAPLVLGHEVAGVVEEVGEGVVPYSPGDRIVTTHHVPCFRCRYCRSDRHSVCESLRTTHFDPGGFAEYVRLPEINVKTGTFLLPDHVTFSQASFVEPLACVVRAQRIAGLLPGDGVAVLGSGVSGALHIQMARHLKAGKVIATDVHPFRLGLAKKLGADVAVDAREDVAGALREVYAGGLADRVIVTTGAPPALDQAFQCVERGGTILFFAPATPEVRVGLPLWDVWRNGITVTTSYSGPPADMQTALDLIASGKVDVDSMVTHRLRLEDIARGFRLMEEAGDSLKILIEPQLSERRAATLP